MLLDSAAHAFAIEQLTTRYDDHRYECELVAVLEAPLEQVELVLRDYAAYPQLDARILSAEVLERPAPNVVLLETSLRACLGPFCRNVERVERVEEAPGELIAITDPAQSEVRFGETRTALEAIDENTTRVSYRTSITPGRWVTWFTRRSWLLETMAEATESLFRNVEREAQAQGSKGLSDQGDTDDGASVEREGVSN